MHLFTADLHFGHNLVAGLRGFSTTEEHDETIIRNFNSVVREDDILWVLGDLSVRSSDETLEKVSRIVCRKVLIAGNHDSVHPMHRNAWKHQGKFLRVFEAVLPYQKMHLSGEDFLLNHLPYEGDHKETDRYTQYRMPDEGLPLLCGHVHEAWKYKDTQFNVGVDVNGLLPVTEETVLQWIYGN